MTKKDEKKRLMGEEKQRTLLKNKKLLDEYEDIYNEEVLKECDIFKGDIKLKLCTAKEEKRKWTAFVHFTTSLPYKNAVGRQAKFFVCCDDVIIGMVHLTSAMAQLKLRDEHIGWSYEEKWTDKGINTIYNAQTCVAMKYQDLLTCKLLVYSIFSSDMKLILEDLYKDKVMGIEITSLYGKSSVYNRVPFLKYLGKTEGNSAVLISDDVWKCMLAEYYNYFPKTETNRQAPVKFQIIDKLQKKYKQLEKEFDYKLKRCEFERGVYFGEDFSKSLKERVEEWRIRWLIPRYERQKRS